MTEKIGCGSVVSNNKAQNMASQEGAAFGPGTNFGYPYDDLCYATFGSGEVKKDSFIEGYDEEGLPIELEFNPNAVKAQGFINKYSGGYSKILPVNLNQTNFFAIMVQDELIAKNWF